ncbi:BPSL1445 family SYLF domain-containing lipoprotein [Echinimonas agarilytica]|uniref:YSC84-related protein n=1 Tax=Echinimonas agarilytica TaxID=1215918 RepID=A0AA41W5B5_9GAMM|nr:YSC84-related protein [Echinimonas agarilytica]MCM2678658.1 YSC84-related protein [Echinimonas agarilytica]
MNISITKRVWLFVTLVFSLSSAVQAASREEINISSQAALESLYAQDKAAKELAAKAKGILVFPSVIKAGIGLGGEYGEGVLMVNGTPTQYYATAAASIGFQLGAQVKSQVILFMTQDALNDFKNSEGWRTGVDGSVAIATLGAGGTLDSQTLQQPIIGFIYSNKGLMYNLNLEGSKITKIDR